MNSQQNENNVIYWCVNIGGPQYHTNKQITVKCDPRASFRQLLIKIREKTSDKKIRALLYSRGHRYSYKYKVKIYDDESMAMAIEFVGQDAFNTREGILVHVERSLLLPSIGGRFF